MANYTTNTSDKKKRTALVFWAVGLVGILGFEYFYVGKIKRGLVRTVIGIFVVMCIFAMKGTEQDVPVSIIFWALSSLPNLFRILLGSFRDNVGAALRA